MFPFFAHNHPCESNQGEIMCKFTMVMQMGLFLKKKVKVRSSSCHISGIDYYWQVGHS